MRLFVVIIYQERFSCMHHTESESQMSMASPDPQQVYALVQAEGTALITNQPRRRGRPTHLSWMHLCMGVLASVLMGWQSQLDLWRLLCFEGFWHLAPIPLLCDQAIYNRIDRAGPWMQLLFDQLSRRLWTRLEPWQDHSLAPFATRVLALDECVLDKVSRWLPELRQLKPHDASLRAGRISALFDLRLQQWIRLDIMQDAATNCKVHAQEMIQGLEAGVLILFDRGYFSFEWLDTLSQRGLFWISRYSNNASYTIVHVNYEGDGVRDLVIVLGAYRSDHVRYPARLIQFWYQGHLYRYLTNICDPTILPVAEVVRLYARRWDIELAFRVLKDHLNLRLLWSAKWSVIQVQLWAGLLLAQYFHGMQYEIACQTGVKPQEVSMDLLTRMSGRWLQAGIDPVAFAIRWGRESRLIRPSTQTIYEVPFVDLTWVKPPPEEVLHPREHVRYAHRSARQKQERAQARSEKQGPCMRDSVLLPDSLNLLE